MTSALVLDELDLDLPATCLLVRLGLVIIVVVVLAALARVGVVDEAIIVGDGALVELVAGALVGHVRRRDARQGANVEDALCNDGGGQREVRTFFMIPAFRFEKVI